MNEKLFFLFLLSIILLINLVNASVNITLISPSNNSIVREEQIFKANIDSDIGLTSYVFYIFDKETGSIVETSSNLISPITITEYEKNIFRVPDYFSSLGGITTNGTNYIVSNNTKLVVLNKDFTDTGDIINLSGGTINNIYGVDFYNNKIYISGFNTSVPGHFCDYIEAYYPNGTHIENEDINLSYFLEGGSFVGGFKFTDNYLFFVDYNSDIIYKVTHNGTNLNISLVGSNPVGWFSGLDANNTNVWITTFINSTYVFETDENLSLTGKNWSYLSSTTTSYEPILYDPILNKLLVGSGSNAFFIDLFSTTINPADNKLLLTTSTSPFGIEYFNGNINIYITDFGVDKIYGYYDNGTYAGIYFNISGVGIGEPRGIATDGNYFYIVDYTDSEVYRFYTNGTYIDSFDTAANGVLGPLGLAYYDNKLYITQVNNGNVYSFFTNGTYNGAIFDISSYQSEPRGIATDGTYFWIAEAAGGNFNDIRKYWFNGTYIGKFAPTADGNLIRGLSYHNGLLYSITSSKYYTKYQSGNINQYPTSKSSQIILNISLAGEYEWNIKGINEYLESSFASENWTFIILNSQKQICSDGELTMGEAAQLAGILLTIILVGTVLATLVMSFSGMIDLNKLGSELSLDKLPGAILIIGLTFLILATMALILGSTVCGAFGG